MKGLPPKYPVINENPPFMDQVRYMNNFDWMRTIAFTAAGIPVGMYICKSFTC